MLEWYDLVGKTGSVVTQNTLVEDNEPTYLGDNDKMLIR